jgi:hypothetical protein
MTFDVPLRSLRDGVLLWGAFSRALGAVFAIQFASLLPQVTKLIGDRGIEPVGILLRAVRRDLGVVRGALRYPTLFWASSSDAALVVVCGLGIAASLGIVTGLFGSLTWLLFVVVWACWLSFQTANTNLFFFPWDNLILESALLGALLPGLSRLPDLRALAAPTAFVQLGANLLLFRVMLGMGIAKFRRPDSRTRDLTFIYHMLEWQPMPTMLAWHAHRLPLVFHKVALVGMFVIEIIAPLFIFGPEPLRIAAAASFVLLQLMIWLVGSYGTFNVLTICLCIPLFAAPLPGLAELIPRSGLDVVIVLYNLLAAPYLLFFSSWDAQAWPFAPTTLPRVARWLAPLTPLYRAAAPFRLFNAYGVFIARANDPRRITVLQWTQDGEQWHDYEPKYLTARTDRRPRLIAPHHPRLDHYLYYFRFGATHRKICCLMGSNPYYLNSFCLVEKLAQKLLRADPIASSFFDNVPAERPRAVRFAAYHYWFTSAAERRATGQYYRRVAIGHSGPIEREEVPEFAGLTKRYAPLIFDTLTVVDGESLAYRDTETDAFVPLHRHAELARDPKAILLERLFAAHLEAKG